MAHQADVFKYLAGIFPEWDSPALVIGGVADHVQALFSHYKSHPLNKIVEEVKKGSSKWMKVEGPRLAVFNWQAGYAAFSDSQSNMAEVTRYTGSQAAHHRKMTFQGKLRALFQWHAVAFDERYAGD